MTLFDGLILGIVEGITEFLPISSTGHLILLSKLLELDDTSFLKSFEIIIQLGAIMSVIVLYSKSFLNLEILKKLAIAFVPTGLIGLTFYEIVKTYFIGNEIIVLWSLFLGGVLLIVFELLHKESQNEDENISAISYTQSFLIGLFQAIAVIPGVSRSGATIVGGLLLGLRRKTIVEFSFLLAVPTMLAASGLDIVKNASSFSVDQIGILSVGFLTAFLVAILSIKFFLGFIQKSNFIPFGVYRIVLALIFWFTILA